MLAKQSNRCARNGSSTFLPNELGKLHFKPTKQAWLKKRSTFVCEVTLEVAEALWDVWPQLEGVVLISPWTRRELELGNLTRKTTKGEYKGGCIILKATNGCISLELSQED